MPASPRVRTRQVIVPAGKDPVTDETLRRLSEAVRLGNDDVTELTGDVSGDATVSASRVVWSIDGLRGLEWLASVKTTDATEKTLSSFVLAKHRTVRVTVRVLARAVNGDSWTNTAEATFKRTVGNVAQVDTTTLGTPHDDAGAAAWTATIDADTATQSVRVRVTGAAATDIRWGARVTVEELG